MAKITLLFVFFSLFYSVFSISLLLPPSATYNATQDITLLPSVSSSYYNPANITTGIEASTSFLFNIKDIPLHNLSIGYEKDKFAFSNNNQFINHPLYSEYNSYFNLSYKWDNIRFGSAIHIIYCSTEGYTSSSAIAFDAGVYWYKNKLSQGISVKNISRSQYKKTDLPQYYLIETAYAITDNYRIGFMIEKEDNYDFSAKIASSYNLFNSLNLLASYQTYPARAGVGCLFKTGDFQISYGVRTHQYLDLTHSVSVGYNLSFLSSSEIH